MKNIHTSHQSMTCPRCRHSKSKVLDKRNSFAGIRRRRQCINPRCGVRFTTYETIKNEPEEMKSDDTHERAGSQCTRMIYGVVFLARRGAGNYWKAVVAQTGYALPVYAPTRPRLWAKLEDIARLRGEHRFVSESLSAK